MSLIAAKKKLLMAQKGGLEVSEVFNTSVWTGGSGVSPVVTGIDSGEGSLVWIKLRGTATNRSHVLTDTTRGATNNVASDSGSAQTTNATSLTGFLSNGYSLGGFNGVNATGSTYVGWQFRRAPKFFDIVQYTGNGGAGRQIGHNLGSNPGLLIIKRTSGVGAWVVRHQASATNAWVLLDATQAQTISDTVIRSFTSATFTLGAAAEVNASGETYIAYIFGHDPSPEGAIQCGSYVGDGSSTGAAVDLGWRPQWLLIKNLTATGNWVLLDTTRGLIGASSDSILLANTNGAEATGRRVTPTPTGFQPAINNADVNSNGQTYIYMAIREAA